MQALKILVIGMGVLIFALLGAVVYGMIVKFGGEDADGGESRQEAGMAPGFGETSVDIPPGCRIAVAEPQGESRILLRLDGGEACQQVLVLDARSGELLGRIVAAPSQ
ncbi:MAG: hypothetical protein WD489_09770 [Rhodovibrionaceae bacterium]